jgi:RNA polymerase primary sigma factor
MNLKEQLEEKLMREPTDEEWCAEAGKINMEAIRQALDEGLEAKNRLVTANLRMVQGVVNIYIRNGLGGQYNAGDMMQEGIMVSVMGERMMTCLDSFNIHMCHSCTAAAV